MRGENDGEDGGSDGGIDSAGSDGGSDGGGDGSGDAHSDGGGKDGGSEGGCELRLLCCSVGASDCITTMDAGRALKFKKVSCPLPTFMGTFSSAAGGSADQEVAGSQWLAAVDASGHTCSPDNPAPALPGERPIVVRGIAPRRQRARPWLDGVATFVACRMHAAPCESSRVNSVSRTSSTTTDPCMCSHNDVVPTNLKRLSQLFTDEMTTGWLVKSPCNLL